jgi:hypothetical protein
VPSSTASARRVTRSTYLLARTGWQASRTDGGDAVPLSSSFLLHDDGTELRIVLYLNHQGLDQITRP